MQTDSELRLRYESKEAAKTGGFAYTGETAPEIIDVWINIEDAGSGGGFRDGKGYHPFDEESVLLYAPHVASDESCRISIQYTSPSQMPKTLGYSSPEKFTSTRQSVCGVLTGGSKDSRYCILRLIISPTEAVEAGTP